MRDDHRSPHIYIYDVNTKKNCDQQAAPQKLNNITILSVFELEINYYREMQKCKKKLWVPAVNVLFTIGYMT